MRAAVIFVSLLALAGCKDPDRAAAEQKEKTAQEKLAEGRQFMASGLPGQAVKSFKEAATALPKDPVPVLLMADALRESGNDAAAILALKQAADLSDDGDADVKRQLIELYRKSGHLPEAIRAMQELKAAGQLNEKELLQLARLQAQSGAVEESFKTLEIIQRERPDDPEAKSVEAEVLVLSGEEELAGKLMDRLVAEHPAVPAVRLVRARYFLNSGFPEIAEQELANVQPPTSEEAEVVLLKARVFNALKRSEDAQGALTALLARSPKDVDAMAMLAETKLMLGQPEEAQRIVDDVLAMRPRSARAMYVSGRALEAQGELKRAAEQYEQAIQSDPGFAPALSRVWRIYSHRGEKLEAMTTLERLFFMNESSPEEKFALAEMYADNKINVERGRKLVRELLRKDKDNGQYKDLAARLAKLPTLRSSGGGGSKGPIIMKGGR